MNSEFDLESRVLCDDDTCIGLVGTDGKCKVCGRQYQGGDKLPAFEKSENSNEPHNDERQNNEDYIENENTDENETDERIMCSDDMCIGVVNTEGICGTCGKQK